MRLLTLDKNGVLDSESFWGCLNYLLYHIRVALALTDLLQTVHELTHHIRTFKVDELDFLCLATTPAN